MHAPGQLPPSLPLTPTTSESPPPRLQNGFEIHLKDSLPPPGVRKCPFTNGSHDALPPSPPMPSPWPSPPSSASLNIEFSNQKTRRGVQSPDRSGAGRRGGLAPITINPRAMSVNQAMMTPDLPAASAPREGSQAPHARQGCFDCLYKKG